ncbi:MAG: hypothetical protein IJ131_05575 [Eggerthellaceae bacterium]|nr:hypothetical protein [Eggerthellaceae bacterium]
MPQIDDEMFSELKYDATIEVFKQDGVVYTAEYEYEIPELSGYSELEDGKRYLLTADITFLNGGVAGYVDYPQIENVINIEEISSNAGPTEEATAEPAEEAPAAEEASTAELALSVDGTAVDVAWEDNESVAALKELAARGPLEVSLSAYGGFEQVGPLGETLPSANVQTTTEPGDIVLYQSSQIVIFYGSNTWDYTRLGKIQGMSTEELEALLGKQGVTVTIEGSS